MRFSIFWRTTLIHSEPLVTTLPPFVPRAARPRVLSLLRRQVFPESARAVYPAVVQYAGEVFSSGDRLDYNACPNFKSSHAMSTLPSCPQCAKENTYPDRDNYVCADCGHEWPMQAAVAADDVATSVVFVVFGFVLVFGVLVVLFFVLLVLGLSINMMVG